MKTTIRVSCVDQVLKIVDRPLLASGGLNEAVVAFDFCEKWNGYAKTGVFYRDEDEVYYSILDDDDICVIPWEVYSTPGYFYFTVFGDKGDVRRTTNTVKYKAQKGLAGSDMLPSDPTPGVYDQIMGRLSEIEQGAGGGGNSGTGENGGYYTPKVSQPNENTMRVSFTASKAGMPSVAAQNITLPAGKDYVLTEADKQEIADMVEIPEGGSGSNIDADWIATKELTGGDTVYIPEQKVSGGLWNNLQMSLQPGIVYDVTFNGEVYTCEARAYSQGAVLGNNESLTLNDYPFCILWAGGNAMSGMFFKRSDISSPVTLKVTDHAYYKYNQLPEEYLPDCVVKSVNGKRPYANGNVEIPTGTVTDEQIASAVEDYLKEHPFNSCVLTVETITVDDSGEPVNIPVTGLTLDLTSYNAKVGDGFYINPVVTPNNATNKAVTWKSNATNIATVNNSGYVECLTEGSAVITCTTVDGGFTATCSVSVAAESSGEPEVTLSSISATYSGGDVAVGTAVTDLTGITVTAHYSDGITATVTDYTLSGTIAEGSNTIAVSYGGKTTTFTVTGVTESGGTTGGKVYFKDSPYTLVAGCMMKANGTTGALSNTGHLAIPYTEGITIATCTNNNWAAYPHFVVLDNGTYTPVAGDSTGLYAETSADQFVATFSGYGDGAVIYANINKTNAMKDSELYYYIIPGGEA